MWECPVLALLPKLPAAEHSSSGSRAPHKPEGNNLSLKQSTAIPGLISAGSKDAGLFKPTYMLAMCPDDSNHAVQYYLGSYCPEAAVFDLSAAQGPFKLDLGDAFYAPNILTDDGKVRWL